MTDYENSAKAFFDQGYNCAQGVLLIHAPELGLDKENASRVGAAFGGGICRGGNTCGAVAGALMVLGLKYGNTKPDDKRAKEKAYVKSLMKKYNWNITWASRASGINRSTFASRMRKLDIHRQPF